MCSINQDGRPHVLTCIFYGLIPSITTFYRFIKEMGRHYIFDFFFLIFLSHCLPNPSFQVILSISSIIISSFYIINYNGDYFSLFTSLFYNSIITWRLFYCQRQHYSILVIKSIKRNNLSQPHFFLTFLSYVGGVWISNLLSCLERLYWLNLMAS